MELISKNGQGDKRVLLHLRLRAGAFFVMPCAYIHAAHIIRRTSWGLVGCSSNCERRLHSQMSEKDYFFPPPARFHCIARTTRAAAPPPPDDDDDDARDDDGTLLKYGDMITIICFAKCGGSCDTSAPAGLIIQRSEKRRDAPLFRTHAKLAADNTQIAHYLLQASTQSHTRAHHNEQNTSTCVYIFNF